MQQNPQTWISTNEAATLLNEDPRTVQRKAKAGTYPGQKLPGLRGSYIFDQATIVRLAIARELLRDSTPAVPTSPEAVGAAGISFVGGAE